MAPTETWQAGGEARFESWIAASGSHNQYYQNCASVMIEGSGNSTLDHLPDMSWLAFSGSHNQYYQNCASVMIEGSGNSTLDHLPDMFVGDIIIPGNIGVGECRRTTNHAVEYPNPGQAITITKVWNIPFKKPTPGNCYSKASKTNFTTPTSLV
ncbi:unnamed protein product [Adineta steineri]|uniref:Uncharacterized protein n=1 Tax=Adineta steineri TaxID=433720 RepID=A0A813XZX0_9BILA|nr:unnamed protein product [Adineta steineri]